MAWLLLGCLAGGCSTAASVQQNPQATSYGELSLHRKLVVHPGAIDLGDRYRSTLQVIVPNLFASDQSPDGQCSGSLIAPSLVLTAAHCVCRERPIRPQDLNSARGNTSGAKGISTTRAMLIKSRNVDTIVEPSTCVKDVIVKGFVYKGSVATTTKPQPFFASRGEVRSPPNMEILFDPDSVVWSNADLAVIVLDKPVDDKIFPVYELPNAEVQPGDRITFVGYGLGPNNSEYGIRRSGGNQVAWIRQGNAEIVAGPQTLADGGVASEVDFGDSGGGCFKADDNRVLVGVIGQHAEDAKGNMYSVMTSVYANRLWLLRQIVEAGGQSPPKAVAPR